ncbi:LysR family transcriptional regulator [Acidisoma cellulosilytica]|uniref:LysR family transcriptional regulator n=1 Tax=Acidisoma cellulosilyticum TaxID=2802395 RepID=A0A964E6V4_9PROT|nr:LysR substrate-binding domain-containing protein [Acidisoma cellulosilyticum]MCB8883398.1 LysR family transcriptional regulator [Acidisoma cellulosilyticum]
MDSLLSTVSLRRLQVFLAVCETLHMALAAEKLGVAQPALSQQIRGLEAAIGARLFHRRKRGIDLTAAGTLCRDQAIRLLRLHGETIEQVQRVARGEAGRIVLGYVGSAMFERRFPAELRRMRDRCPGVELSLREGSILGLLDAVGTGDIDIALVRAPIDVAPPLKTRFHSRQPLCVILPQGHALARLSSISIGQLAEETMIGLPDSEAVGIMRVVTDLAHAAGISLPVKWHVSEVGSVLGLVAAGLGFGIVPEAIADLGGPEIAARPLQADPLAYAELRLVWHEEKRTPALSQFLSVVDTEVG